MTEAEDYESEFDVEYYLLEDGTLGRVWYDVEADEYFDGEVLGPDGRWEDCPAEEILDEGEEVSFDEASEIAREMGGTV